MLRCTAEGLAVRSCATGAPADNSSAAPGDWLSLSLFLPLVQHLFLSLFLLPGTRERERPPGRVPTGRGGARRLVDPPAEIRPRFLLPLLHAKRASGALIAIHRQPLYTTHPFHSLCASLFLPPRACRSSCIGGSLLHARDAEHCFNGCRAVACV